MPTEEKEEAEMAFRRLRWPETNGEPVCPRCDGTEIYALRDRSRTSRWRCKACVYDFSVTSGTSLAFRKMPLSTYLAALRMTNEGDKVVNIGEMARTLGCNYRSAHFLLHRLRADAPLVEGRPSE